MGAFPCARGKKRAVLIGISYASVRRGCGQLRGPINDVKCMRQLLCQRFAFPSESATASSCSLDAIVHAFRSLSRN